MGVPVVDSKLLYDLLWAASILLTAMAIAGFLNKRWSDKMKATAKEPTVADTGQNSVLHHTGEEDRWVCVACGAAIRLPELHVGPDVERNGVRTFCFLCYVREYPEQASTYYQTITGRPYDMATRPPSQRSVQELITMNRTAQDTADAFAALGRAMVNTGISEHSLPGGKTLPGGRVIAVLPPLKPKVEIDFTKRRLRIRHDQKKNTDQG